jgi:glutaredoxin
VTIVDDIPRRKTCPVCRKNKSAAHFWVNRDRPKVRLQSYCMECVTRMTRVRQLERSIDFHELRLDEMREELMRLRSGGELLPKSQRPQITMRKNLVGVA